MASTKQLKTFNVLRWDFNSDSLQEYDVLEPLRNMYKYRKAEFKKVSKTKRYQKMSDEQKKEYLKYRGVPHTLEEFKEFIEIEALYHYWCKCEHEIVIHGWPVRKEEKKIDVYTQIKMNIDIIAEILFNEFNKK